MKIIFPEIKPFPASHYMSVQYPISEIWFKWKLPDGTEYVSTLENMMIVVSKQLTPDKK